MYYYYSLREPISAVQLHSCVNPPMATRLVAVGVGDRVNPPIMGVGDCVRVPVGMGWAGDVGVAAAPDRDQTPSLRRSSRGRASSSGIAALSPAVLTLGGLEHLADTRADLRGP